MFKSFVLGGLMLAALVGIGSISHGAGLADSSEVRSSAALNPHLVGKLVDIITTRGESFVRVKVLDTDEHFIYIEFQNREHGIPWGEIHNIQFSR